MNVSDEYFGPTDGTRRWKDLLYRLEGLAVAPLAEIFLSDWIYAGGEEPRDRKLRCFGRFGADAVQIVPPGPDLRTDALYEALLSAVYASRERIWIVTPYFVPDDNLLRALIIAHHNGVDVKLITPKVSNHLIADLGCSPYMRDLEEAGVDVALYTGEMLHAEAILFDRMGAMVGSVNFDNRSLFLNCGF